MEPTSASYFWSNTEPEFCLSVIKELNIIGSLDGRKHRIANQIKSVVSRLRVLFAQNVSGHICNAVWEFNSAKATISHSGLNFSQVEKLPRIKLYNYPSFSVFR